MIRIIIFLSIAIQSFFLIAQTSYWGIEFSLSDQKSYVGNANHQDFEAAFRTGDDAQDNGFAGISIFFDVASRKFSYSAEGGMSTNLMLVQIHKISTDEVMSIFFQLEPKCEGVCMITFPRIPFQAGTFEIAQTEIQYNPIIVNPKNNWRISKKNPHLSDATPKAITEIPYYPNPSLTENPAIPMAETEPISQSKPLIRKTEAKLSDTYIGLSAMKGKGGSPFLLKCTTPNKLEKPIATIFDFNTEYDQIIIEFKDIPYSGENLSPLSKEIEIPNIPYKTYSLIVLYNNIRSTGRLIYTKNSLEISLDNNTNIVVLDAKANH